MAEDFVTWPALAFVAGIVVASVVWTTIFWSHVEKRTSEKIKEHEERYHPR